MKRLKVLICAHELSPYNGSECAVGWNLVTRIAKYHDVTVLFASGSQFRHSSYIDVVNKYFLTAPPIPGLIFKNIDKPRIGKFIVSINSIFKNLTPIGLPPLYYIAYKYWQKSAFKEAKRLHKIDPFDIVHQLTQITFREPGYLWRLGIPFIWGPTGMTSTFPKSFHKMLSGQSKFLEKIRTVSNIYQFNYNSRVRKANEKAAIIYTFSRKDAERLQKRAMGEIKIMLDVGTYNRTHLAPGTRKDLPKLRGIWCGRLSDYKAPEILLKALALNNITREEVEFQIIGKGSLGKKLVKMADDLKLKNIEWISEVRHDDIFGLMNNADFLVHTSLREATSSVIPEALSMGIPVICHDAFGMGIAINDSCGIKIPLKSPEESIFGFHEAIKKLIVDRELLIKLKNGADSRSKEISWDNMAEIMATDYSKIVNNIH